MLDSKSFTVLSLIVALGFVTWYLKELGVL